MRFALIIGIVLLFAVSGCGAMKESFNRSFDQKFKEGCRKESLKRGADPQVAERYCDCAVEEFKKTDSTEQAGKTCAAKIRAEMHLR